jgi:hypothetical protein
MGRVHAQEGRTELLGQLGAVFGLEEPQEDRLQLQANVLTTTIVTNPFDMACDPDCDQHHNQRRPNRQDPERQPERSDDD